MSQEIKVPDIGDFKNVPVIEILVKPGDVIKADDTLITLESDKATLDVPAPRGGKVEAIGVHVGDKVSAGTLILTMADEAGAAAAPAPAPETRAAPAPAPALATGTADMHADLVVLGAGPGGYSAAFRAADLGMKVTLVERWPMLGGVCLNVGCIPSKALLHAAKLMDDARGMGAHGISFGAPQVDIGKLRDWKQSVVNRLVGGLSGLAKARKVTVVQGLGRFTSPTSLAVSGPDGVKTLSFSQCIIAAGSEPVTVPFIPHDDPRVIDSTGALELADVPKRLLVLGGGIIGLEMATVYHALGSRITIVEFMDQLMPGADKDMVAPLAKRIGKLYEAIHLQTKVTKIESEPEGLRVHFESAAGTCTDLFDKVLVSVGRRPNGGLIDADKAGVAVNERGFIPVSADMRTNVGHIFAIGDIVGQPMLAHKATHEAKVAAENAAGHKAAFDARVIPSVAYTDPEVAWVGVTETEAKTKGIAYGKGVFPWAASGRSLALGRDEGLTKVLFDEATQRIIGCGIVGPAAGDLIAEAALAIEMGADAADIGNTIHPHPTLSETIGLAAEMFEGTITDLIAPKKK
ncbi:MAG: dihydrolipoyl dehydrogenase [Hyphomicrobiales bacterium]|nr:dihydrolipoyl dehydrogenase [Hyphomicrobiales bacterium]